MTDLVFKVEPHKVNEYGKVMGIYLPQRLCQYLQIRERSLMTVKVLASTMVLRKNPNPHELLKGFYLVNSMRNPYDFNVIIKRTGNSLRLNIPYKCFKQVGLDPYQVQVKIINHSLLLSKLPKALVDLPKLSEVNRDPSLK